ncbi:MAG: BsuPI-related putative proteinase inhibitor [Chloroflexota bacterium]|nr:BsuPI-related putative proteinase inhibitor [Chloroflexota bacterium]
MTKRFVFLLAFSTALGLGTPQARADFVYQVQPLPVPPVLMESIETDKSVYSLPEDVQVVYRVTNISNETYAWWSWAPAYDVVVSRDAEPIWWVSYGEFYNAGPVGTTLSPGQSKELRYTWDMKDNEGNMVTPGTYEIEGGMYLCESTPGLLHGSVIGNRATNITIIPEPASLTLMLLGLGYITARKRKRSGVRVFWGCYGAVVE